MKIRGLGYIGFHATDLAPWRSFAEELLGFMPAAAPAERRPSRTPSTTASTSAAGASRSTRATEPGLAYIGWELADRDALAAAADHLDALRRRSRAQSARPRRARPPRAGSAT